MRTRIRRTAEAHGRNAADIRLIAVSKTRPVADIAAAHAAGQTHFGENYLQEAVPKMQALTSLPLCWHFLGRCQANKTRLIAGHFHWVHTLDRLKVAERLARQHSGRRPLNVLVQVNVDEDPAKGGVAPVEAAALAEAVHGLPQLRLRGLMTILEKAGAPDLSFARMRTLFDALAPCGGDGWDTLSMGMSDDMEAAIAAGATQVRIGKGVFGPRNAGAFQENS